jgi:hypothetical protein
MENEQAKGRPGGQARRAAILSFSALFAMHSPQPPDPHRLSINGSALKGLCHQLNIFLKAHAIKSVYFLNMRKWFLKF